VDEVEDGDEDEERRDVHARVKYGRTPACLPKAATISRQALVRVREESAHAAGVSCCRCMSPRRRRR